MLKSSATLVVSLVIVIALSVTLIIESTKSFFVCVWTGIVGEGCREAITENEIDGFISHIIDAREEAIKKANDTDAKMYGENLEKWARQIAEESGDDPDEMIEKGTIQWLLKRREAEVHLRALLTAELFSMVGLGLESMSDEELDKELDYFNGKYAGSNLAKTWLIARDLNVGNDWTFEDRIMNARLNVWKCYFVGDVTTWYLFGNDKACDKIDKKINELSKKSEKAGKGKIEPFIREGDHGVLIRHIVTTQDYYECVMLPPKKPEKFTAKVAGEHIQLSWERSYNASKYTVEKDGDVIYEGHDDIIEFSLNELHMSPGETYAFTLEASNTSGGSGKVKITLQIEELPEEPVEEDPEEEGEEEPEESREEEGEKEVPPPGPGDGNSCQERGGCMIPLSHNAGKDGIKVQEAMGGKRVVILASSDWEEDQVKLEDHKPYCKIETGGYEYRFLKTVEEREVKYKDLVYDLLFAFEKYALLEEGITYDSEEESYREMIIDALLTEYEEYGVDKEDTGIVDPPPSSGMFALPLAPDAVIPGSDRGNWVVTSEFSPARKNPVTGKVESHNGIDIGVIGRTRGTRVHAAADGKVVIAQLSSSAGNYVVIDHGNGWGTRYMHMSPGLPVRAGDVVKQGDLVGYMDTTGQSTGVHLHFEVCTKMDGIICKDQVNPRTVLDFPPIGKTARSYY